MSNRILIDGVPVYLHGANYPWMVKNGKSNYGLDFGANMFGTHEGVTTNRVQVEHDFALMEKLAFNTLRWFVFTDGRGGIRFGSDGVPAGVSEKFYEDMDCALTIAHNHHIKIIFVLLDYLWLHNRHAHVMTSVEGRTALVENVLVPLFERYASNQSVLAWEVMNEPDWVINELSLPANSEGTSISLTDFKSFVGTVVDTVHTMTTSFVTVGGTHTKSVRTWDDDALGLDFLQVHAYNDVLRNSWDEVLFGRDCDELGLRRPLLIGEFSTNSHLAFESTNAREISLHEYLDFCYHSGYAGALYWSFNAVDKCGCESVSQLRSWIENFSRTQT